LKVNDNARAYLLQQVKRIGRPFMRTFIWMYDCANVSWVGFGRQVRTVHNEI
jgi:hypothetical protein